VTAPVDNVAPEAAPPPRPRPRPTLAQRIVAFTFLGAFGLTMLTVVLTGLYVRSPSARRALETPAVTLTIDEPRTINLVFGARSALAGVELTVDLPPGVELVTHPGERRIVSRAELATGDNALPLTLVARSGSGGQLAARLRQGDERKVFVVDVTVAQR
jgi:hypothetical protein